MKGLIVDTSTERGLVALSEDTSLVIKCELPFGLNHSQDLMNQIDKAFKNAKWKLADLDYIALGVGPGSYTGIRVGASVAKTLSYTHRIPLIGLSTLQLFVPSGEGEFIVLIDAKIGGVYWIKGENKEGEIVYTSKPEVSPLENLPFNDKQILVSPNSQHLKVKLNSLHLDYEGVWEEVGIDPIHASRLSLAAFNKKEYSTEGRVVLSYMRRTQAEIERESLRKETKS